MAEVIRMMGTLSEEVRVLKGDRDDLFAWRKAMIENTLATKEATDTMLYVVDLVKDMRGAFKAMGWIGRILKWVGVTGAGFAAIYATMKGFRVWP